MRDENFGQALLEHLNALYGFAMVLTQDRTEAQDLVQETYLRALKGSKRFETGSKLKAWLFIILRNIWINQQRVRHRQEVVNLGKEATAVYPRFEESPDVVLECKLQRHAVRTAIESLPVVYREIVILRDIEGLNYRQIAETLECPVGTVMSRLGRARALLRQILSKSGKASQTPPAKPALDEWGRLKSGHLG